MASGSASNNGADISADAVENYRNDASLGLTEADISTLENSSGESIAAYVDALSKTFAAKCIASEVTNNLWAIVDGLRRYEKALDVLSNIQPMPMSLIWGLLKIAIQTLERYREYFSKASSMFAQIGHLLPRYEDYSRIFGDHPRLNDSITRVYGDIKRFCEEIRRMFFGKEKNKASAKRRLKFWKMRKFFRTAWEPFENNFAKILVNFQDHRELVELEARTANMIENHKSRKTVRQLEQVVDQEVQNAAIHRTENRKFQESAFDHFREHAKDMKASRAHMEKAEYFLDEVNTKKLQEWLYPVGTKPRARLDELQSQKHPGTNAWILQHEDFRSWRTKKTQSLWIVGIPGAGKSVLASSIICHFQKSDVLIAYFFCSFKEKTTLQPYNVIGSLLSQMAGDSAIIASHLQKAYDDDKTALDFARLRKLLQTIPSTQKHCVIIIDGLDEMEEEASDCLLESLAFPPENSILQPQLLAISRARIGSEATKKLNLGEIIDLTKCESAIEGDISQFVSSSVEKKLRDVAKKGSLKTKIISRLVESSQGMFQLAQCQIERLKKAKTEHEVEMLLKTLPTSLYAIYEEMLQRVKTEDRTRVRRALLWLTFAERTLTIRELAEAVCVERKWEWLDKKARLLNYTYIKEICGNFVSCIEQKATGHSYEFEIMAGDVTPYISLAHSSVREFLLSDHIRSSAPVEYFALDPFEGHSAIASVCFTYSSLKDYNDPSVWARRWDQIITEFPLLLYASVRWYRHAWFRRKANAGKAALSANEDKVVEQGLVSRIVAVLTEEDNEQTILKNWVQMHNRRGNGSLKYTKQSPHHGDVLKSIKSQTSGLALYYALAWGLEWTAKYLIQEKGFSIQGVSCQEPLVVVASRIGGSKAIKWVKFFVEHGADIMALGFEDCGIAHIAAQYLDEKLLKFSIQGSNAKVLEIRNKDGMSPFLILCNRGHLNLVKFVLDRQRESIKDRDLIGRSGLQIAWKHLDPELCLFLRKEEEDARLEDSSGANALHWSVFRNDIVKTRTLLDNGANVEERDKYGRTPLHIAVFPLGQRDGKPNTELIILLLDYQSNPFAADEEGTSPLEIAFLAGAIEICKLMLLEANRVLQKQELSTTATVTNKTVMKIVKSVVCAIAERTELIPKTIKNGFSETELACTLASALEIVLAPRTCPNVDTSDVKGGINLMQIRDEPFNSHVLHYLVHTGRFAIPSIKAIIQAGGDIDVREQFERTPLHLACGAFADNEGFRELFQFLISEGADVTAVSEHGFTAIMYAVDCGAGLESSLETLLDVMRNSKQNSRHIEMLKDARNEFGETALMIACRKGSRSHIQTLLGEGCNPLVRNLKGIGILQAAIEELSASVFRWRWYPDIDDSDADVIKFIIEVLRKHNSPGLIEEIMECSTILRNDNREDLAQILEDYVEKIQGSCESEIV